MAHIKSRSNYQDAGWTKEARESQQGLNQVAEENLKHSSPMSYNNTVIHNYSPWRSPLPYLFGGIVAMLMLITFALLLLACSYWKKVGHSGGVIIDIDELNSIELSAARNEISMPSENLEDKVVVIMAGDEVPTSLAKPVYK
ncbi:hypothetical protein SUGI_0604920 [Cryptomeria japonica]|nr:hypothetical protein SUGI_0604920 [Cryptomeria japonica]